MELGRLRVAGAQVKGQAACDYGSSPSPTIVPRRKVWDGLSKGPN